MWGLFFVCVCVCVWSGEEWGGAVPHFYHSTTLMLGNEQLGEGRRVKEGEGGGGEEKERCNISLSSLVVFHSALKHCLVLLIATRLHLYVCVSKALFFAFSVQCVCLYKLRHQNIPLVLHLSVIQSVGEL